MVVIDMSLLDGWCLINGHCSCPGHDKVRTAPTGQVIQPVRKQKHDCRPVRIFQKNHWNEEPFQGQLRNLQLRNGRRSVPFLQEQVQQQARAWLLASETMVCLLFLSVFSSSSQTHNKIITTAKQLVQTTNQYQLSKQECESPCLIGFTILTVVDHLVLTVISQTTYTLHANPTPTR